MTAKEMFEKLGYVEITRPFTDKAYRKLWTISENIEELKAEIECGLKLTCLYIEFDNMFLKKSVHIRFEECKAEIDGDDILAEAIGTCVGVPVGATLTLEEIQAINKQTEELEWNQATEEVKENE